MQHITSIRHCLQLTAAVSDIFNYEHFVVFTAESPHGGNHERTAVGVLRVRYH